MSDQATAAPGVQLDSTLVSGFHERAEHCPEVFRSRHGGWVACNHASHKTDAQGNVFTAEERLARIYRDKIPVALQSYALAEEEAVAKPVTRGNAHTATKKRPGKEPRPCTCGCGEMTKGGRFIPGHDAKMRGRLIRAAQNESLELADRKQALADLREHKWEAAIPDAVKELVDNG